MSPSPRAEGPGRGRASEGERARAALGGQAEVYASGDLRMPMPYVRKPDAEVKKLFWAFPLTSLFLLFIFSCQRSLVGSDKDSYSTRIARQLSRYMAQYFY